MEATTGHQSRIFQPESYIQAQSGAQSEELWTVQAQTHRNKAAAACGWQGVASKYITRPRLHWPGLPCPEHVHRQSHEHHPHIIHMPGWGWHLGFPPKPLGWPMLQARLQLGLRHGPATGRTVIQLCIPFDSVSRPEPSRPCFQTTAMAIPANPGTLQSCQIGGGAADIEPTCPPTNLHNYIPCGSISCMFRRAA